jgi:hypothetical protein
MVTVKFENVEFGLITLNIKENGIGHRFNFSDTFDPFEEYFKWIEDIINDVEKAKFSFMSECRPYKGHEHITFVHEKKQLFIYGSNDPEEKIFNCSMSKEEIVMQFYGGLMEFVKSGKYDYREYEWYDFETLLLHVDCRSIALEEMCRMNWIDVLKYIGQYDNEKRNEYLEYLESGNHADGWYKNKEYDLGDREKRVEIIKESVFTLTLSEYNGFSISLYRNDNIDIFMRNITIAST